MLFKVIIIIGLSNFAFAKEDGSGHAAAAGGKEATPATAQPKETFESGRQSMEWVELVNKVQTAKGRVEAQRSVILQLIEQKKSIVKQEALTKQIQIMSEENKKLNKLIDDYEEQRSLLQYRFPEKGITELRKYDRVEKKSIEDFETEISVEGQLNRNMHKMKKQFKGPKNQVQKNDNVENENSTGGTSGGDESQEPQSDISSDHPDSGKSGQNLHKKRRLKIEKQEEPSDSITRSIKIVK